MTARDVQAMGIVLLMGAAIGAAVYVAMRGIRGVAADLVAGAAGAAEGAIVGAVEGIGGAVGIPKTDAGACCAAIRAGDTWEASFACPASDYLAWLINGSRPAGCQGGATGRW